MPATVKSKRPETTSLHEDEDGEVEEGEGVLVIGVRGIECRNSRRENGKC
jgi:hypothetical protein